MKGKLLTTKEAAERLGLNENTLAHWRRLGKGPPWVRVESRTVRYPEEKLTRWIERRKA